MKYIEALKEIQHQVFMNTDNCEMTISKDAYRKIEKALGRQIPMKPIEEFMVNGNFYYYCPRCHEFVKSEIEYVSIINEYNHNHNHCGGCGQKIDWSDIE